MATPVSSNNMSTHNSSTVKIQIGREQTVATEGRHAEAPSADKYADTVRGSMGVDSQVGNIGAEIKPVNRRTIEGSYNGKTDKVQMASKNHVNMEPFKNPPAPREQMRGQQNSKHYKEDGSNFRGSEFVAPETGD
jgi:hypothetical protein